MPNDNTAKIRGAMGVRSVFLAAKLDEKLVGRFAHMSGDFLLDRNGHPASKRALADVMVYMSGQYGKTLSAEEVEMGLLAAATEYADVELEPVADVMEEIEEIDEHDPDDFIQQSIDELPDDTSVEMELAEPADDWVTDQYVVEAPVKKKRKSRPGVKPDEFMLDRMRNGSDSLCDLDAGISSYELALRFYDFIGNDLARPESEDVMGHKIKLAIGSTMKELGWKKKMRKGSYGWHPVDVVSTEPAPNTEGIVLRKKSEFVKEEPEESVEEQITDSLPRLSSLNKDDEDDLPWPDMEADFTDGSPDKEMGFVKIVNFDNGTEEVEEMEIVKDKTMTYVMSDDGAPLYLEWDAEEGIWTYTMSGSNE